jgi:hypothetical protein
MAALPFRGINPSGAIPSRIDANGPLAMRVKIRRSIRQKLGSGDCPTMPCDVAACIVLPKGLVRPGSARSRHQRSDGDCA